MSSASCPSGSSTCLSATSPASLASAYVPSSTAGSVYMMLLALQFACQPLLTKRFAHPKIVKTTYVFFQDLARLALAIGLLVATGSWGAATKSWTLSSALQQAGVPAALYVLQNYCSLMAYQNLSPITYNVLNQTKTLSAALFCYLLFGQAQTPIQILALFLLVLSALVMESIVPLPTFLTSRLERNKPEATTSTETALYKGTFGPGITPPTTITVDPDAPHELSSTESLLASDDIASLALATPIFDAHNDTSIVSSSSGGVGGSPGSSSLATSVSSSSTSSTTALTATSIKASATAASAATAAAATRHTHWKTGVLPILVASLTSGLAGAWTQRCLQQFGGNSLFLSVEMAMLSAVFLALGVGMNAMVRLVRQFVVQTTRGREDEPPRSKFLSFQASSHRRRNTGRSKKMDLPEQLDPFSGWTWTTWIPLLTNAGGGLLVGLVTKYAGTVAKGFALILGLFVSGLFQDLFHDWNAAHAAASSKKGGGEEHHHHHSSKVTLPQWIGGILAGLSLWMHHHASHVAAKSAAAAF